LGNPNVTGRVLVAMNSRAAISEPERKLGALHLISG
jgi:hypothetical protein